MENRFAGAQNPGDRRRRWLSQDEDTSLDVALDFPATITESEDAVDPPVSDSLLQRAISPRIWKIAFCIVASTLISTALIWSQQDAFRTFSASDSEPTIPSDIIARYSGLLLLAAAAYAVLIGWIRSESEVDFKGRYRCWRWMAVFLMAVGSVQTLSLAPLIPEVLHRLLAPMTGPIQAARPAILLAVSLSASALLLYRVVPDMGKCVWSQATLISSVLILIVRFMLQHGAHSNVDTATLDALFLLSANAAFASMLMHCRFVAYVDNSPPVVSSVGHDSLDVDGTAVSVDGEATSSPQKPVSPDPPAEVKRGGRPTKPASAEEPEQDSPDPEQTPETEPPARRRRKSKRKRRAA